MADERQPQRHSDTENGRLRFLDIPILGISWLEWTRRAAVRARKDVGNPEAGPPGRGSTASLEVLQILQTAGEATGVAALGLGERLEPLGDLVEALLAGGLRHARVHLGVLVGLTFDG